MRRYDILWSVNDRKRIVNLDYNQAGVVGVKERKLLLLGLLLSQSLHGYQINDVILNNLSGFVEMKRSTVYSTLDNLCASGHVQMNIEQVGNRPPRKVYTVTDKGQRLFDKLLRELLFTVDGFAMPFDTALLFLDTLPQGQWAEWLRQRKRALDEAIRTFESTPSHAFSPSVQLGLSHRRHMMEAERDWLEKQIHALDKAAVPDPASRSGEHLDKDS